MVEGASELIGLMGSAKTVGENAQRSALGIAGSHVQGNPVGLEPEKFRYEAGVPFDRDTLAGHFIEIVDGLSSREAARAALGAAREWLNAPYANDPAILKWRAERAARGPLGAPKEDRPR